MFFRLLLFLLLSTQTTFRAQQFLGVGASIHRYDQVLGLNYLKVFRCGGFGLSGGLGVERTLQGAIAPQMGLFWQGELQQKKAGSIVPIYTVAYQLDFQKSSFLDVHQGLYLGLGFCLGEINRFQVQLLGGVVRESMLPNATSLVPVFLNPQLQALYFIPQKR
jgi:hypothetical protein